MSDSFNGLKPENLWKHFGEMLKIPHGSGNEKALGDYVLGFAEEVGLEAERDAVGNVIVRKPASEGHENAVGVILQGHLDMVCEKNSDIDFDFSNDAIQPVREGDWITAQGTTLGADNAIGLAASMAIMEDGSLEHGPLEFLFTVEEETGLTGANQIQPGFLKGRKLLNLDSEDEGEFTIGCAGGADTLITLPLQRGENGVGDCYTIKMSGFKGGHSGVDINLGRANAIKVLGRILWETSRKVPFQLIGVNGGNLRNAIPRETSADVLIEKDHFEAFQKAAAEVFAAVQFEYKVVDPDAAMDIAESEALDMTALTEGSKKNLIDLLFTTPHGVIAMHSEMTDLVETSSNLAVIKTHDDKAEIICSTRSSIASSLEATRNLIVALGDLIGAKVDLEEGYPGWTPNLASPLLKTMKEIYKNKYGVEPKVAAIHAGLECGIIGEKFDGMDMISFGPTIKFPHSPDEKVEVNTVDKFWDFLLKVLEELT